VLSWPAKPASAGPPPTLASLLAPIVFVTGVPVRSWFLKPTCQDLDQGRMGGVGWKTGPHVIDDRHV